VLVAVDPPPKENPVLAAVGVGAVIAVVEEVPNENPVLLVGMFVVT